MRSQYKMMEISTYDEIYTRLHNIKSMYDSADWSALICVCEGLTEILERLAHASLSQDIRVLFFKCLGQMSEIVYNDETNDFAQTWCADNLEELHGLLNQLI